MTEDEIRLLIKAAQSEKTRLIIQFLYKTACRVSEIIGIRLTDCKPINSYIKIRVIGKGSKERDVAIPKDLYEAIKQEYGGKMWLFESKSGKSLHPDNIANQIRKAARRAGFENWRNCTPHKLRHARSTDLLLRKGLSLKAVSKMLGHQSVSTTAQMYIHDSVDYHELFAIDTI